MIGLSIVRSSPSLRSKWLTFITPALQLGDKHRVTTPVNWKKGEDVIVHPMVTNEEAKTLFPDHTVHKVSFRKQRFPVACWCFVFIVLPEDYASQGRRGEIASCYSVLINYLYCIIVCYDLANILLKCKQRQIRTRVDYDVSFILMLTSRRKLHIRNRGQGRRLIPFSIYYFV